MPKRANPSAAFLRFLALADAIRGLPSFPALDALEERLFHALALIWAQDERISVREAMASMPGMSPATVHRRLKSLQGKGLIDLEDHDEDGRLKLIVPTATARQYFAQMGQCIDMASKA